MASVVLLSLTFCASTFAFPQLRLLALTFASTRLRHFAFAFALPVPQRLAMDVRGAAARVQTETRKSVAVAWRWPRKLNQQITEPGSNERALVLIRYSELTLFFVVHCVTRIAQRRRPLRTHERTRNAQFIAEQNK